MSNVVNMFDWKRSKSHETSLQKQHRLLNVLKQHTQTFTVGDTVSWNNTGVTATGLVLEVRGPRCLVRIHNDIWTVWVPTYKLTLEINK